MESFGEKLRITRESLGYSIEQIARDTNISKRYLIALENEDFSIFPGETYLKGFLQNYAEYLGLHSEEMITLYRNMKIQEQPIPIDQLLDQKTSAPKKPVLLAVLGGVIVAALIIVIIVFANAFRSGEGSDDSANGKGKEFLFAGEKVSLDVIRGFSIMIPINNVTFPLTAQKIDKGVTFTYKDGSSDLIIGEEKQLDLDKDGIPDISIFLKDIFTEQNQKRARLTLQKPSTGGPEDITTNASDQDLIDRGIAKVILEKPNPNRFTIDITVVQNCFLIYYLDKKDREEKYGYKGDTLSLSVEKNADIRFSDGASVKVKIDGNDLDSGSANQLSARKIKWLKSENNTYKLVSIPVK
jgi:transcriptional regulator with XRE-family HTH domain